MDTRGFGSEAEPRGFASAGCRRSDRTINPIADRARWQVSLARAPRTPCLPRGGIRDSATAPHPQRHPCGRRAGFRRPGHSPSDAASPPDCSPVRASHARSPARQLRLSASDTILAFITTNVVISGLLDWGRGKLLLLPLPPPSQSWHLTSSAMLVVRTDPHGDDPRLPQVPQHTSPKGGSPQWSIWLQSPRHRREKRRSKQEERLQIAILSASRGVHRQTKNRTGTRV